MSSKGKNSIYPSEGGYILEIYSPRYGIILSKFSSEDLDIVARYNWCVMNHGTHMYIALSDETRMKLHRFLLDPEPGFIVDHSNGDTLDNTRGNLRICTVSQNNMNLRNKRIPKCIYKRKDSMKDKWRVILGVDHKRLRVGTFDSYKDAVIAYNIAVVKYHGEYAVLHEVPNA